MEGCLLTDLQQASSKSDDAYSSQALKKHLVNQAELACTQQQTEIELLRDWITARKRYARMVSTIVIIWLSAIFLLLLIDCICEFFNHHLLPVNIMMTLVGSTTFAVIGLFGIVLGGIFPNKMRAN